MHPWKDYTLRKPKVVPTSCCIPECSGVPLYQVGVSGYCKDHADHAKARSELWVRWKDQKVGDKQAEASRYEAARKNKDQLRGLKPR